MQKHLNQSICSSVDFSEPGVNVMASEKKSENGVGGMCSRACGTQPSLDVCMCSCAQHVWNLKQLISVTLVARSRATQDCKTARWSQPNKNPSFDQFLN